jgi:hypothetical protein
MKRTFLAFCFLIISSLAFAQNGVIKELSGTVELKKPGSEVYVPAKAGDILSQSTLISTGFKSTALIQVGSAQLTVRPLTRLTLTEITAASQAETLNVNLQAGRVRVDVKPPAGTRASATVTSPSATASVRGTSFEFDTRNLFVNNGTVSFKGSRGAGMLVNGGSSSQIGSEGKAANPIEIANSNLKPAVPVGADSVTGGIESSPIAVNRRIGSITISLEETNSK